MLTPVVSLPVPEVVGTARATYKVLTTHHRKRKASTLSKPIYIVFKFSQTSDYVQIENVLVPKK